jgi:hypothetical protein
MLGRNGSLAFVMVAAIATYGADPLGNTPEEFSAMIAAETALWADTVKSLGLKF